jgi:hypothetical protein
LVVIVPAGAGVEALTVTVGGATVTYGSTFTVIPAPTVNSVLPDGVASGQTVTVAVQGLYFTGATFSVSGSDSTVSSATVDPSGVSASLQVLGGATSGFFNIVATNDVGSSPVAVGNRFVVLPTPGYASSAAPVSVLNLNPVPGAGYAISSAPVSVLNRTFVPGSGYAISSAPVSVLNRTFVPGSGYAISSAPVSVLNSTFVAGTGYAVNAAPVSVLNINPVPGTSYAQSVWISVLNNAAGAQPARSLPALSASGVPALALDPAFLRTLPGGLQPAGPIPAFVGQTIPLIVTGGADGLAALTYNGVVSAPAIPAGPALFTVPGGPAGPETIEIRASADGVDGPPLLIGPVHDPGRSIHGRVLAANGAAIPRARVQLRTSGLDAEYFDSKTPLTALPDLTDRQPDREGFVSALNIVNPHGVFGNDPFGTGMMPDYAARFRGHILADSSGDYRFFLTSHAGSRLMIDGQTIAEIPLPYSFDPDTAAGTVSLTVGRHEIEVLHFEAAGPPVLRLEWQAPGGTRQVVDPGHLIARKVWEAVSDERGEFVISGVPSILDVLELRVACKDKCTVVLE